MFRCVWVGRVAVLIRWERVGEGLTNEEDDVELGRVLMSGAK